MKIDSNFWHLSNVLAPNRLAVWLDSQSTQPIRGNTLALTYLQCNKQSLETRIEYYLPVKLVYFTPRLI